MNPDRYPLDSDGDVLRGLVDQGINMSLEREIDFSIAVPNREIGLAIASLVEPKGFKTKVQEDSGRWTCYCSKSMVPSYGGVISVQEMLEEIGRSLGAKPDGWGTLSEPSERVLRKPTKKAELRGIMGTHEGFPLSLRVRPDIDSPATRSAFTRLLVVEHRLSKVKSNGLPESEYNLTLADFDHDVFRFVEGQGNGLIAIVETFAGKRTYYAFVDATALFDGRFKQLEGKHPEHELSIEQRDDPQWGLYEFYRKQFPWDRKTGIWQQFLSWIQPKK